MAKKNHNKIVSSYNQYDDDYVPVSKKKLLQEKDRKRERNFANALKSKNVSKLIDEDDYDDNDFNY